MYTSKWGIDAYTKSNSSYSMLQLAEVLLTSSRHHKWCMHARF